MCAQFMIKANLKELARRFGTREIPDADLVAWKGAPRVVPYSLGPVWLPGELKLMQFSLLPSWSKEKKVKFATHNARLDGVDTKPTWRKVFRERRCVVPMTDFVEP
ncbi:MAG: SOS response-associated peptidase family protein, partial [Bdellovibrionota bacterium]